MHRLVLISLPHSLKSKGQLTSYWIGRWGRPYGARTSDHAIAPATDHATTVAHTQWGDNIQSVPEGQLSNPGDRHTCYAK